jgi:hypothetical protein
MQVIKQGPLKSTQEALSFFKEYFDAVDKVKYIVLYFAEREWRLNPELYHQYAIVIGENAQLWMSGLGWGYCGEGPYGLFEAMQMIDPSVNYEQIESLEWPGTEPILFENVEGKLVLKPFNKSVAGLIGSKSGRLPWESY